MNEKLEIKTFDQLSTKELYQFLKLRVDVFVVEQNCPYPELSDKDEKSLHYMLYDGQELAAYLRTYQREKGVYAIGRIVTDHRYRGKGLAGKLIHEAIAKIQSTEGAKEIYVQGQSPLVDYYRSFGLEVCSQEYLEDNIPHTDLNLKF
ncbi:GNAT family N-acetyltransferase [Reichenbachiella agarivorans]|uniref:GNAT family N-acetyltransferase n=1 Tax=Reichenbachiella agarivorans TaxID=2979464 RepID=A0ABY6CYS7_9BACT|nr:GNAT family N-acetyltransferase [Reichenbachiella agarivorans]UXP33390.1 GNAT family N-acetyltransferase [Reichenbachiella agarivorans]